MSILIKKVFFFPFLLFSVLLPILFLSGCIGGVRGDSVSLTYTIGGGKNPSQGENFEKLIGSSKPHNNTTVFGAETVQSLLGTKKSSDDFKKKIKTYIKSNKTNPDFWNDYINSKGRFTEIKNMFGAIKTNIDFNKKKYPTPSGWHSPEDTNKQNIKINKHIIEMIYGAPKKQGDFQAKKWKITVELKELSFWPNKESNKINIGEYDIMEIKLPPING